MNKQEIIMELRDIADELIDYRHDNIADVLSKIADVLQTEMNKAQEAHKEYICMYDTLSDTEKQINSWIKEGYQIEIVEQQLVVEKEESFMFKKNVFTSLWKWKEEPKSKNNKPFKNFLHKAK